MKERRNLSGIYFRSLNTDTGKWDNVCFEDLTEKEQDNIMFGRDEEWMKSMVKKLSETLNDIGEQLNLYTK